MIKCRFEKKRLLAGTVAALLAVTGIPGVEELAPMQVKAADVTSVQQVNEIFEQTRTDFRDESIYSVMTTRFYDGDTGNNVHCWDDSQAGNPDSDPAWRGDFQGLIDKLDYIKALGFTAICITPVAQNASGYDYHGEHPINMKEVDPRYESDGVTYEDFLNACHEKDMKVVQSITINSTGNFGEENLYPIMEKLQDTGNIAEDMAPTEFLAEKAGLSSKEEYSSMNVGQQYQTRLAGLKPEKDELNIYHHDMLTSWDDYTVQFGTVAGDCVDLNTENPVVTDYLTEVFETYMKMGVDAFLIKDVQYISRLTYNKALLPAIYQAEKNLDVDIEIFGEAQMRSLEVIYNETSYLSVPFYTWNKGEEDYIWSETDWQANYDAVVAFSEANKSPSVHPTGENALLDGITYHTPDDSQMSGIRMVDFPMQWRFASAENAFYGAVHGDAYYHDATWNITRVDSFDYGVDGEGSTGYNKGIASWLENLNLLFTFRGIPWVNYGSEIEFQKDKPLDLGPNVPLAETGRAYYGEYLEGPVEARGFGEYGLGEGAIAETLNSDLALHIQALNRLRQAIPALRKGQYTTDSNYVSGKMAFIRRYTDAETDSLALVTITDGATFKNIPNGVYVDAVTGDVQNVTNGTLSVATPGKGRLAVYVAQGNGFMAAGVVVPSTRYLKGGAGAAGAQWTVENISAESISVNLSEIVLEKNESAKINVTILPQNVTDRKVSWNSSNTEVARVDLSGKVTAVGTGTAVITATAHNGIQATVTVTVTEASDGGNSDGGSFEWKENWIYFRKPENWSEPVNIYIWNDTGEPLAGGWPGSALTDLGNGIHGCELPEGAENIIFNDGSGRQTSDLEANAGMLYDGMTQTWENVLPVPATKVTDIFTDVYNDWYTDYIQYVYDHELMKGIGGTTEFGPNANITKAQVAQVLYNMEGRPTVTSMEVFETLSDVYQGEWYADAVAWAYSAGVVTGNQAEMKFFPNADVTREQMALMMYRYAKLKDYDTTADSDLAGLVNADKVSDWAESGVRWAVGAGLISGSEKDGVKDLVPQGNATRAQVAAILQRFMQYVETE